MHLWCVCVGGDDSASVCGIPLLLSCDNIFFVRGTLQCFLTANPSMLLQCRSPPPPPPRCEQHPTPLLVGAARTGNLHNHAKAAAFWKTKLHPARGPLGHVGIGTRAGHIRGAQ